MHSYLILIRKIKYYVGGPSLPPVPCFPSVDRESSAIKKSRQVPLSNEDLSECLIGTISVDTCIFKKGYQIPC